MIYVGTPDFSFLQIAIITSAKVEDTKTLVSSICHFVCRKHLSLSRSPSRRRKVMEHCPLLESWAASVIDVKD